MDDMVRDLSVPQAEEIFKSNVAGSLLSSSGPGSIDNDVSFLQEFFVKLRFQYLEQEARDKFISYSLLKDLDSVSRQDIEHLAKNNAAAENELHTLDKNLETVIETNKSSAEAVLEMYRKLEGEKSKYTKEAENLKTLEAELESLINAPENESCNMLYDLNKMIEFQDIDPADAIQLSLNNLISDEATLQELVKKELSLIVENDSLGKTHTELETKLSDLKQQLDHESGRSENNVPDPEQARAQKLRRINSLIQKITAKPVDVRVKEENYELIYNEKTITFDKNLRILSASDNSLTPSDIQSINIASFSSDSHKFPDMLTRKLLER